MGRVLAPVCSEMHQTRKELKLVVKEDFFFPLNLEVILQLAWNSCGYQEHMVWHAP